jgi:hypothetical protein
MVVERKSHRFSSRGGASEDNQSMLSHFTISLNFAYLIGQSSGNDLCYQVGKSSIMPNEIETILMTDRDPRSPSTTWRDTWGTPVQAPDAIFWNGRSNVDPSDDWLHRERTQAKSAVISQA